MKVAVAGGTGAVGSHVVRLLQSAGEDAVVLARSRGVDLTTGVGLAEALAGVEGVIDVSSVATLRRSTAVDFFTAVSRNLLAAGQDAGVRHHVTLSIVGIDRVDFGYYVGKRHQEALVLGGPVPATVLRATQFHEFAEQTLSRSRGPVALVPRMRIAPVAAREVAAALVRLVGEPPVGRVPDLAGPREEQLVDMVRALACRRRRPGAVVAVRVPGGAARAMATGALLPGAPGPRGEQTFGEWLTSMQPA